MKVVLSLSLSLLVAAAGCADGPGEPVPEPDASAEADTATPTEYTDWTGDMTGTTAKPAFGKGCRYKAVGGEVWKLPADGSNDRLTLVGPASGPVTLTLYVIEGLNPMMLATVDLERTLTGKAYYKATGPIQFGAGLAEMWTVVDGTLCFESSLVDATTDIAGEFSLIAEEDGGTGLRTVGGTFTVAVAAITGSDSLNVNDQSITLDLQ